MKSLESISEQIHLPEYKASNLINWAIDNIQTGIESESMIILAGLSYDSNRENILGYFNSTLMETSLTLPVKDFETEMGKMKYFIIAMNKKYLSAKSTLMHLKQICYDFNYSENSLPFYILDDKIDLLLFENNRIFRKRQKQAT